MKLQEAFNLVLNKLGPFETRPHVAVAVSGGSDSLTLALLTQSWVAAQEGQMIALIVDHNLRPESASEAERTAALLLHHHIPSVIFKWEKPISITRLQENAREARYTFLKEWCHNNQVLHLLLGHHQEDQQETYLLRQEKKSSPLGLSGMSQIIETPFVRILRPLLAFSKDVLRDFLLTQKINYIEDPSNHNTRFSRVRFRQQHRSLDERKKLNTTLQETGFNRMDEEKNVNEAITRCVDLFPEGYGSLNLLKFHQFNNSLKKSILQRCIMTFGVGTYSPKQDSLQRILENLERKWTLQGCLIFRYQNILFFIREPQKILPLSLKESQTCIQWDDRFRIFLSPRFFKEYSLFMIRPLCQKVWDIIKMKEEGLYLKTMPFPLRQTLPTLWAQNIFHSVLIPSSSFASKFTKGKEYDIYFAPRYTLTRHKFVIV